MTTRKDGSTQNLEHAWNSNISSRDESTPDQNRVNDEDGLDTRDISHDIEEGDEDYDDEELAEEDFAVDKDDVEDDYEEDEEVE